MSEARGPTPTQPAFAHASEAELARILDFYDVRWAYEPHTFPILWNLDGAVIESFSPDFYLPDLDLYVELTTLKQSLVRKKNRKLRRLRELYPDIRIKLFYARDFRALMLKFGRVALVDALSGTSGQVVHERAGALDEVARTVDAVEALVMPPSRGSGVTPAAGAAPFAGRAGRTDRDGPSEDARGQGDDAVTEVVEIRVHDAPSAGATGAPATRRRRARRRRPDPSRAASGPPR